MATKLEKMVSIFEGLSKAANILAILFLVILLLLTVMDVFLRTVFNRILLGTVELTEYMMLCLVVLGLAWCAVENRHVKVDLIATHFRKKTQRVLDAITAIGGLCLFLLLAYQTAIEAYDEKQLQLASDILSIPTYPFYYILSVGFFLFSLALFVNIYKNLSKALKDDC